ncbi:hypothetical protein FGO68_gene5062 [Halteria grandinella]|uniref:Secreted protein n=1 Tax=Halteria grandinella TaxID=5974 RepID=A0A8J8NL76_HALGN|nr:hypothetical protein FGO68_gene5062 [Halteria grandinella]
MTFVGGNLFSSTLMMCLAGNAWSQGLLNYCPHSRGQLNGYLLPAFFQHSRQQISWQQLKFTGNLSAKSKRLLQEKHFMASSVSLFFAASAPI